MSYGKLEAVFHLGEFSKVAPSFEKVGDVIGKNMEGTTKVIEFCRKHKIKLIYAGSSTKYSKDGENSSPYAFSKAKNAQMIKNYGKWFGLKYSICYFYNNYGPYQDTCGDGWETVISIFEKQKKAGKKLTIVKPGTQKRNYTHVEDTIDGLIAAWLHEKNGEYQLGSMESYDMFELAKLFDCEYELIPERPGDRMESAYDYMLEDTYRELKWKPKHKLENWIK
jgi:UDP-glucose 4-epimerase